MGIPSAIDDLLDIFRRSTDAFGNQTRLNFQNIGDLAGHYPYSPERFRVFVNGERQFIQYDGEPPEFSDQPDVHTLSPQNAGDVVTLETTEIYRYAVGYVLEWSFALKSTGQLQSGDSVIVGYGNADLENSTDTSPGPNADGWFWIWDSELPEERVRIAQYRNGTEQFADVVRSVQEIEDWTRRETRTNWYAVGESSFTETYIENEQQQFNRDVGRTAVEDIRGPQTANKHIQVNIKTGTDSAGTLDLEVGSIGLRQLGDIDPIVRRKTVPVLTTGTAIDITDEWLPFYAIRIDPDRRIINVDLTNVGVKEFSGQDDIFVSAQAMSPDYLRDADGNPLDASDWSTPPLLNDTNSVIQETFAVDQFPDQTGTITTSTTNPGGYQEGWGSLYTEGTGASKTRSLGNIQAKRILSERDVIVFLARTPGSDTGDVQLEYVTEQKW